MGKAAADSAPATGSADAIAYGSNSNYEISLIGAETVVDSDDEDALRLYLEFTNNSDEPNSAFMALDIVAMQDGTELERAYVWDDEYMIPESDYYSEAILPGVTIRCAVEYKVDKDGGAVEFEISDWWEEESLTEFSLDLGKLPGAPKSEFVLAQDWDADYFDYLNWEGVYSEDYYIVIDTAEIVESAWSDDPVLRVYFEFTNNSEETTSFWSETYVTAFQNGKSIPTYGTPAESVPEDENDTVDVAPGDSIVVSLCMELIDETPVIVYIEDYYGDGLACTFELS